MPNPQGRDPDMVPVYYGIPYPHTHLNYDDKVKVYQLERDGILNKPINLEDFV